MLLTLSWLLFLSRALIDISFQYFVIVIFYFSNYLIFPFKLSLTIFLIHTLFLFLFCFISVFLFGLLLLKFSFILRFSFPIFPNMFFFLFLTLSSEEVNSLLYCWDSIILYFHVNLLSFFTIALFIPFIS